MGKITRDCFQDSGCLKNILSEKLCVLKNYDIFFIQKAKWPRIVFPYWSFLVTYKWHVFQAMAFGSYHGLGCRCGSLPKFPRFLTSEFDLSFVNILLSQRNRTQNINHQHQQHPNLPKKKKKTLPLSQSLVQLLGANWIFISRTCREAERNCQRVWGKLTMVDLVISDQNIIITAVMDCPGPDVNDDKELLNYFNHCPDCIRHHGITPDMMGCR